MNTTIKAVLITAVIVLVSAFVYFKPVSEVNANPYRNSVYKLLIQTPYAEDNFKIRSIRAINGGAFLAKTVNDKEIYISPRTEWVAIQK